MKRSEPLNIIRIIGLRRSGNHAITNWIVKQKKEKTLIINDICPESDLTRYIDKNTDLSMYGNFVFSYEDHSLNVINGSIFERSFYKYLKRDVKIINVLIVRDPFNLFASRMRSKFINVKALFLNFADFWVHYANEYIGNTRFIEGEKIGISYNEWCNNEDYRKYLSEMLNLSFTDEGFNDVPSFGGGSSFDGKAFRGNAKDMNTSSRWKSYVDDKSYQVLFKDKNIFKLSKKIFGDFSEANQLIQSGKYTKLYFMNTAIRSIKLSVFIPLVPFYRPFVPYYRRLLPDNVKKVFGRT